MSAEEVVSTAEADTEPAATAPKLDVSIDVDAKEDETAGDLVRVDTIGLPIPPSARMKFSPFSRGTCELCSHATKKGGVPCSHTPLPSGETYRMAVLGSGSFGTALAVVAARNGHSVMLYARDKKQVDAINTTHMNPKRFPDFKLPDSISATNSVREACIDFEPHLIFHCVPCQFSDSFLTKFKDDIPADKVTYVCTAKGVHLKTKMLMSELIPHCLGYDKAQSQKLAYLSGPSFAKEIIERHPMSVVCASEDFANCRLVQKVMNSVFFRVYSSVDVIGVEVGGALKNPLAIGAGIARGLGYGQSTIASIVTRGAVEMKRLALKMGGTEETLSGLSGMGDLMLTCHSALSRNQRTGYLMGSKGMSAAEAQALIGECVEGVATAAVVLELIKKYKLTMPLFETCAHVLAGDTSPHDALHALMHREPTMEYM